MSDDWTVTAGGRAVTFMTDFGSPFRLSEAPEIGHQVASDDVTLPGEDGTLFGSDTIPGQTVTFTVDVDGHGSEQAGRALLADLRAVWRDPAARGDPSAVATVLAPSGRLLYGRPRRFSHDDSLLKQGWSRVVADFQASTDVWFAAPEQTTAVSIAGGVGGGLEAPLAAPLSTTASSDRSAGFTVGGQIETWPILTVQGPVSNVRFGITGVAEFLYPGQVGFNEALVVDCRPHARSVLQGGVPVGLNPASSRLADARLTAGAFEAYIVGSSMEGTATLTVAWHDAYPTW